MWHASELGEKRMKRVTYFGLLLEQALTLAASFLGNCITYDRPYHSEEGTILFSSSWVIWRELCQRQP